MRILLLLCFCLSTHASEITLMTFNVENLFDHLDDPGKRDETFLPLSQKKPSMCKSIKVKKWKKQCLELDWSEEVQKAKQKEVAQAILKNGPADILILQEVENFSILEDLRKSYLAKVYPLEATLIEGNDYRGIDIAVLSRFPVTAKTLHRIPFRDFKKKDKRGILEVQLQGPTKITVFGVHFPAPFHPARLRVDALNHLNQLALKKTGLVLAAGDFNIPSEEEKKRQPIATFTDPIWQVAHKKCKDCLGTSYYPPKKSWSFLDMILLKKNDQWQISKVEVANLYDNQKDPKGRPLSFDPVAKKGVSDHFPLKITIDAKQK